MGPPLEGEYVVASISQAFIRERWRSKNLVGYGLKFWGSRMGRRDDLQSLMLGIVTPLLHQIIGT